MSSLFRVFDIAGSGMSAQSARLNTTASNLANADSVSSSENKTYKARQPVFAAQMADVRRGVYPTVQESVGVSVLGITESTAPLPKEYQPDHPLANEDGYIYKSNVNTMEEMANMISASRSYQLNVEISETAKQMLQRTLNLGQ